MALYHVYNQTVADGTATSVVRPSDWNSAHSMFQQISGNTAGATSNMSATNIVFQGGNNVTLSANTAANAATIVFSAANQTADAGKAGTGFSSTTTAGTAVVATLNTAGLSMGVPAFLTAAAGGGGAAVSIGGNSTSAGGGYSNITSGTAVLMGGTNITLSQNGASISIVAPTAGGIGMGAAGNSSGTSGGVSDNYVFAGTGGILLSQSTNAQSGTLSIGQLPMLAFDYPNNMNIGTAIGNGTMSIQRMIVPHRLSATRVDCLFSHSNATSASAATGALAMSVWCGIYTLNGSTLSSVASGSTQTTYSYASNTAGATYVSVGAIKPISAPVTMDLLPGIYYVGFNISTTNSSIGTATFAPANTFSVMCGVTMATAPSIAHWSAGATATSKNISNGMGLYSAAVNSVPPTITHSAINMTGTNLSRANINLMFRG